jgi:hypothetical protein
MIDWLANQVAEDMSLMMYYNVITQQTMETRFPNSNRSYLRFKDVSVCGGDLNAVDKNVFAEERPIWQNCRRQKTSPQTGQLIGIDTLFLVALRLITLQATL